MKRYLNKFGLVFLASAALLSSCQPDIDVPEVSRGEADFTRYVALGNSLTAGFADAALYREGQLNSYPNILAQQFKLVGGGEFKQPLITVGSAGDIGLGSGNSAKLVLGVSRDCRGASNLGPVPAASAGDQTVLASVSSQGPFNNFGVPGALSYHLLAPGYGDFAQVPAQKANPFFARFASSATTSILNDAMAQNPTFFTLWIGNNDVLGYAISGGNGTITPQTGLPGQGFDGTMEAILGTLTSQGAKGAIANIPDVTNIPYFTTVPYNGLSLDTVQAAGLTQAYAPLGIRFRTGNNPFIIADANAPGGLRQIRSTERILMTIPQDSLKCGGWGSQKPIPANYVLDDAEISIVKSAVNGYNATIRSLADKYNLAHVDAFTNLNRVAAGVTIDQINYNAALVTGNIFSLDGMHFTPRGSAYAANLFIQAINQKYNAKLPTVTINNYNSVVFP